MSQCYDLANDPVEIAAGRRALADLRQAGAETGPLAQAIIAQLPDGEAGEPNAWINHTEAQELHEGIGVALELGDPSGLKRSREIAAIVVSDTDPERGE